GRLRLSRSARRAPRGHGRSPAPSRRRTRSGARSSSSRRSEPAHRFPRMGDYAVGGIQMDTGLEHGVSHEELVALLGEAEQKNAQLEEALESRIVIEQAKGVLAERLAVSVGEAF